MAEISQEEMDMLVASMAGGDDGGGDPPTDEAFPMAGEHEAGTADGGAGPAGENEAGLTPMDVDILGEVYNVSMGAAAGAISSLLRMKVDITAPQVTVLKESDLTFKSLEPALGVEINYIIGVQGINIFILSQLDVMKIVDIWMGGSGQVDEGAEFNDMHVSAIGEMMNQMMGQSSMALAGFLNTVIDISAPTTYKIEGSYSLAKREPSAEIVATKFKLLVGDGVIDSELITTCDVEFAKSMISMAKVSFGMFDGSNMRVQDMVEDVRGDEPEPPEQQAPAERQQAAPQAPTQQHQEPPAQQPPAAAYQQAAPQAPTQQQINSSQYQQPPPGYYQQPPAAVAHQQYQPPQQQNIQPVTFASFDPEMDLSGGYMGNINLIRRVPLDITAEIGQTKMPVRDVLEFGEGSIIPFERHVAEPIDIFANGVLIAKGNVVVLEENFGVRITEIIAPEELIKVAGIN